MLKELRKEANIIFKTNYKNYLFLTFLWSTFNAIAHHVLNYIGVYNVWNNLSMIIKIISLIIYAFIEFVGLPIITVCFFKIIIKNIWNGALLKDNFRKLLNIKSITKIVLINFIPQFFVVLAQISNLHGVNSLNIICSGSKEIGVLFTIISFYFRYKFFLCNYYYALKEDTVKNTIGISFDYMKKFFIKYISLTLLVLPWELLCTLIYILCKISVSIKQIGFISFGSITPFLDVLNCFWFGFGFYIIPFVYIISSLFAEKIFSSKYK